MRSILEVGSEQLHYLIAKKVISIQINDAYERPYADSILRDESMHDRLAPEQEQKTQPDLLR